MLMIVGKCTMDQQDERDGHNNVPKTTVMRSTSTVPSISATNTTKTKSTSIYDNDIDVESALMERWRSDSFAKKLNERLSATVTGRALELRSER